VVSSEKLIELGNSWFSPKELLGSRHGNPLGVELLKGLHRAKARQTYQTPNTRDYYVAVRLRGLSSVGQKGNSPDLNLRSLNLH
jgi:hypothetical protein